MRTVALLWRSAHPGPTIVVTIIALGLGASVDLWPASLIMLVAAVFFGQISIGLSNDAIDAPRDRAVHRQDKPLAQLNAPLKLAWFVALGAVLLALTLSLALGWQVALAHLVFLSSAWAYNAGLKSTPLSALCFMVGFGAFVSLAPLSLSDPMWAPAWASIAGGLFGLAIHFSNALPDFDEDRVTGVRGLPHRLGRRVSAILAFSALVVGAGTVAAASASFDFGGSRVLPWLGFGLVGAVALAALIALLHAPASRHGFRLVMLAALLLVVQLLATGGLAGA